MEYIQLLTMDKFDEILKEIKTLRMDKEDYKKCFKIDGKKNTVNNKKIRTDGTNRI